MMKSNRLLLGVLLGSALLAAVLWGRNAYMTKMKVKDYDFAVPDTARIGKIFLANRNGGQITLERKGPANWLLNGKYKARQSGITNLLEVFAGVQLRNRLPEASIANVVKDMGAYGVKVEIYDLRGKLLKAYYVGSVTAGEDATYLMMADSDMPYCVMEPRRGNIRVSYMTNEQDWRDKALLPFDAKEYKRVWLQYSQVPQKSFDLLADNGGYLAQPLIAGTPVLGKYRAGSAESFLDALPRWVAEGFQNDNVYRDSVSLLQPFATLGFELKDGRRDTVRLYPILSRDQEGNPLTTNNKQPLIERYFANASWGDFYSVGSMLTEQVLRPYEFFVTNSK
jgi:hypothetical protein